MTPEQILNGLERVKKHHKNTVFHVGETHILRMAEDCENVIRDLQSEIGALKLENEALRHLMKCLTC